MTDLDISKYSSLVRLKQIEGYSSLFPLHEALALEGQPWFGQNAFRSARPFREWEAHGFADFQFQPGVCQYHLGSARAVHHRGWYLKGVGVTPLYRPIEGNYYHGTGHLFPSSAAREYLISEWVKGLGLQSHLVPCEGVLVAPIDGELRAMTEHVYSDGEQDVPSYRDLPPQCDLFLRAISVKSGPFTRFTNFNWYLHTQIAESMGKFVGICSDWSRELGLPEVGDSDFSQVCVDWRDALVDRLKSFFLFQQNGIIWCSMNNNFTSGLRFLDLELPIVTDPGFLFDMIRTDRWDAGSHTARIEVFQMVREVRLWILECIAWCRFRADRLEYSGGGGYLKQKEMLRDISAEMEDVFLKSVIFDDSYWRLFVFEAYSDGLAMSQRPSLERLVRDEAALRLRASAEIAAVSESVSFPSLYSAELANHEKFSVPQWWVEARGGDPSSGAHAFFARLIRHVEGQDDAAGYLSALEYGRREIERFHRGAS